MTGIGECHYNILKYFHEYTKYKLNPRYTTLPQNLVLLF